MRIPNLYTHYYVYTRGTERLYINSIHSLYKCPRLYTWISLAIVANLRRCDAGLCSQGFKPIIWDKFPQSMSQFFFLRSKKRNFFVVGIKEKREKRGEKKKKGVKKEEKREREKEEAEEAEEKKDPKA